MPFVILDLPDETLKKILESCCVPMSWRVRNADGHFITTLSTRSCYVLSTNKRLLGICDTEKIREEVLDRLFWARTRFFTNSWFSILRAVMDHPPEAASQKHKLVKGIMSMEVHSRSEIWGQGRNRKCALFLNFIMHRNINDGLNASGTSVHILLPKAYLTPKASRTKIQKSLMLDWQSDRSDMFSEKFADLHKDFVESGFCMFPDM